MGLDGVEIIMNIEQAFGLTIKDGEAENVITVNDLYILVKNKLEISQRSQCKTSRVFYKVRRSLVEVFHVRRADIRPSVRLSSLVPKEDIRKNWGRLKAELGVKIPDLQRPRWLEDAILYFTLVLALCAFFAFGLEAFQLGLAVIIFSILSAIALYNVTKPLEIHIPGHVDKLSHFTYSVLSQNPSFIEEQRNAWVDKDLFRLVQAIIAEQMDFPIEKVKPQSSLIDDLGIG